MQIEPMQKSDEFRVWLSMSEQTELIEYYEEYPERQLAIELMLDGLRSDEVPRVSMEDFRRMDTDQEGWMVQIWESKTDYRECPVSAETKKKAQMLKNIRGTKQSESLVNVSKRTVQRWVTEAAEDIADGSKYWEELSAHDLRRTWATHTYWRIDGDRSREVVMSWGGWSDVQTFTESYLGTVPDSVAIDIIHEADLA